jgi:hypothetical protein
MFGLVTLESLELEWECLRRAALLAGHSFACPSEVEVLRPPAVEHDAAPVKHSTPDQDELVLSRLVHRPDDQS